MSAYLWRGKGFHSKVSSTQHGAAGRVLAILEVELQPQISRKITWVLLALLGVSSNSKLALSTAVRDTGSSSKASKGEFSWVCSVPGQEACGKLKQQQSSNPWPRHKIYRSIAPLPQQHGSADMLQAPGSSQSCPNTATLTARHLSTILGGYLVNGIGY